MAKKVTKAHNRHTETGDGMPGKIALIPLTPEKIAALRRGMQGINKLPETWLDRLERLATLPDDSDAHNSEDKRLLLAHMDAIRGHIKNGDAQWAAYEGLQAGVIAHKLGWSEKDAEEGEQARKAREKTRANRAELWPMYQEILDEVRGAASKYKSKSAAQERAATLVVERGLAKKCSRKTIANHTTW